MIASQFDKNDKSAVLAQAARDEMFFRRSGNGITLSGGEALLQAEFATATLWLAKERMLSTAVEISGYLSFDDLRQALPFTNLFLYDLKRADSDKHKTHTGVPNERIIENLRELAAARGFRDA